MASVVRLGEQVPTAPAPLPWRQQAWAENLPESIERGAEHLISLQAEEGYWLGELEADSTLESFIASVDLKNRILMCVFTWPWSAPSAGNLSLPYRPK